MLNRLRLLFFTCLPQHALSRIVLRLSRIRTPLKRPLVRWFIERYGVNMAEAAEPDPQAYASFNDFFTRALRDDARPLEGEADTLLSPVDGRISQIGRIHAGRIFQAKGIDYSLQALVGGDADDAAAFTDGSFATLYLAPGDYHRIHMPLHGRLRRMVHIPGRLFSVAPWTVESLPGLFARNERVCALFDTEQGPLGLVLVGAINVAAIETVWAGLVTPPTARRVAYTDYPADSAPVLDRGAEMGRFNMGSTVIVLSAQALDWHASLAAGKRVRLGEAMAFAGSISSPA